MENFHLMKTLTDKRISTIKENTPKLVGKSIREERERQNLSQTELAEAVGKDRQYLYKIESGKVTPNVSTIAILAEALGVSLNELLK
jgi:transcriptional regulator with XRE-family HTH domain